MLSPYADLGAMHLRTPIDVGNIIRERRKKLGLDQATLAKQVGVSRQWIVEVEKGKPRAETGLVLRTLNALGIDLVTHQRQRQTDMDIIDRIIEQARSGRPPTP